MLDVTFLLHIRLRVSLIRYVASEPPPPLPTCCWFAFGISFFKRHTHTHTHIYFLEYIHHKNVYLCIFSPVCSGGIRVYCCGAAARAALCPLDYTGFAESDIRERAYSYVVGGDGAVVRNMRATSATYFFLRFLSFSLFLPCHPTLGSRRASDAGNSSPGVETELL